MSGPFTASGGRIFGLETEYGILVDGRGAGDLMEESRQVVLAYRGLSVGPWDGAAETPRRDLRGFQVDSLSYDTVDARFDSSGGRHYASASEQRADRMLLNGARLYNDHGHPEYSTPECRSLFDLVAHDAAGERIIAAAARERSLRLGVPIRMFKNNTDYHGASYGCHESYLFPRDVPFPELLHSMLPFLATRCLYAGAGKVGVEAPADRPRGWDPGPTSFQLSQRADFFEEIASVDTLARRPLFNTRDEPHGSDSLWRRVHIICGDANRSRFATALKVGATALVLRLIESGWKPLFELEHPVRAFQAVSRADGGAVSLPLRDGRKLRATDVQRVYLEDVRRSVAEPTAEIEWVLTAWQSVLDDLDRDPDATADRLDWAAKRRLFQMFIDAEGIEWDDPLVQSLDLAYHDLDPEEGLFSAVEAEMICPVSEAQIERALMTPPSDTRAALRSELISGRAADVRRLSWGRAWLSDGHEDPELVEFPPDWGAPGERRQTLAELLEATRLVDMEETIYTPARAGSR